MRFLLFMYFRAFALKIDKISIINRPPLADDLKISDLEYLWIIDAGDKSRFAKFMLIND